MWDTGRLQVHGSCHHRLVCKGKWVSLDQTVRNLTCGDLEVSFVVIRLGVIRLKNTAFVYLLDLFGGSGERGGVTWNAFG